MTPMQVCGQESIVISASLEAAVVAARHIAQSLQPPPPDPFLCQLALHEALINAVLHGSNGDPAKKVTITISQCDEYTSISITDQGEGFDWKSTVNELVDASPLRENQRGLLIILSAFHLVSFNEKGNQIELHIRHDDNKAREEECT